MRRNAALDGRPAARRNDVRVNVFLSDASNLYTISLALAAGILCRRWWHVAVASAAIVIVSEAVLFISRPNHKFDLAAFAVAALVPAVLISLMVAFKKYRA
jgi:hypothetical protein